jgi:F-type H+-transporting ATPase subunit gamma
MGEVTATVQDDVEISYIKPRPVNKVLIILVTSNKGLCGAFNANLIRQLYSYIQEHYPEQNEKGNVHNLLYWQKRLRCMKNRSINLISTKRNI